MQPLDAAMIVLAKQVDSFAWWSSMKALLDAATLEEMDALVGSPHIARIQALVHAQLDQLDEYRDQACSELQERSTAPLGLLLFTPVE